MKQVRAVSLALLLTACSLAPEAVVPTADIPASWRGRQIDENAATIDWEDYGSAELAEMIETALAHNTDIAASTARIAQARATAVIAGSGLYPAVAASGGASNVRSNRGGERGTVSEAGIDIAYELDLWGRNRNLAEAAETRIDAAQFERQALALSVAAETARLYTGLVTLREREAVATKNLAAFRDVLRVTKARYGSGSISGLELAQQETAVATTEAATLAIANQRDLFFNQLALVTGVAPAHLRVGATDLTELRLPALHVTSPWTLLTRRPDIARAEAQLRAATIDIGVARANALPSVQLGLGAGIVADPVTRTTNLVASFFAPIFQGGALQAEIDRTRALRDESTAAYRTVLLTAFREVEDALSTLAATQSRVDAFDRAAAGAERAFAITQAQYKAGSVDFLTLLDTQRSLLQTQDAALSGRQEALAASIDLFRALGGSYENQK